MPITKKLSAAAEKKISKIEGIINDLRENRMTISPIQAKQLKKEANEVLSTIIKLTKTGVPANSIDKAIFQEIKKNDLAIKKEIKSLLARRTPDPADYYNIYYKILKESGLISNSLASPEILEQLKAASDCGWCNACKACTFCGLCAISGTAALGGTGAIAGHASKAF